MSTATLEASTPGVISPGVLYRLDEIKRRMKISTWALRTARSNGLRVRRIGKHGFILGDDIIAYFRALEA